MPNIHQSYNMITNYRMIQDQYLTQIYDLHENNLKKFCKHLPDR